MTPEWQPPALWTSELVEGSCWKYPSQTTLTWRWNKILFRSLPRNIAVRTYDICCYYSESRIKELRTTRKLGNNKKGHDKYYVKFTQKYLRGFVKRAMNTDFPRLFEFLKETFPRILRIMKGLHGVRLSWQQIPCFDTSPKDVTNFQIRWCVQI
jgi:hypothetical protein